MADDRIIIVEEIDDFAGVAARWIADRLREIVADRGEASVALSGGSTPGPVYDCLGEDDELPWDRTRVYFADERAVPPDHPESNYELVRRCLLVPLGDRAPVVHRMEADRDDLPEAARDYEEQLPDPLDLVVLGIGADGHTASLFPGWRFEVPDLRRVAPVVGPDEPRVRLTLTPRVLRAARSTVVLATGRSKAGAVRDALAPSGDLVQVPARLVRQGHWVLDSAAASAL